MEINRKSQPLDIIDEAASLSRSPLDQTNHAAAREAKRVEYEERTTVRKCLNCEKDFRSEGIHNRLCRNCQNRR